MGWLERFHEDDDLELYDEVPEADIIAALIDRLDHLPAARRSRARRLVLHWWGAMQYAAGHVDG